MLTQREKTFPVLGLWEGRKQAKYQTKLFPKKEMFSENKKERNSARFSWFQDERRCFTKAIKEWLKTQASPNTIFNDGD